MATLLVFHTQEWLVKYSSTIMDLWRRVIVFIILRPTNSRGTTAVKRRDGAEGDANDEVRSPPRKRQASDRGETGHAEKDRGGMRREVWAWLQRRPPEIRAFRALTSSNADTASLVDTFVCICST